MAGTRTVRRALIDQGAQIYLDHAATSWPKPAVVTDAVCEALTRYGGNPGRGSYPLALETARAIERARADVASLLGAADPSSVSFQPSATQALNLLLRGLLSPGDRVVVSGGEHNAVRRPLNYLAEAGVDVVLVPTDSEGYVDLDQIDEVVSHAPTALVVCQHVSNLTGAIQPIADLADIAHARGAKIVVDGAQAAGHVDVSLDVLGVDAWAASGHKGLLGPAGVGVMYLAAECEPGELVSGGGVGAADDPHQPTERPGRYEAGTPNTPAILGLGAAAKYLRTHGVDIRGREAVLTEALHRGALEIPGMAVLGPELGTPRGPLVSLVHERIAPEMLANLLARTDGIASRAGMHCTPWSHRSLGTEETGALRLSVGWSTTSEDIEGALEALRRAV